jgi:transcriptional regulator with PAS, ATPase and Fis domain
MRSPEADESRYRRFMRALLRQDYFTTADWRQALRDLARMVRDALGARESLVALYSETEQLWSAITSSGHSLADHQISERASRSILEQVRLSGRPMLSGGDTPLDVSSASVQQHELVSALAVPLYWWSSSAEQPRKHFAGCVYADRTLADPPFSTTDVELVQDVTEVVQRTLNALRHLSDVQEHLHRSRQRLQEMEEALASRFTLGDSATRDPWLAEHVVLPLKRVARSGRVHVLVLGPTGAGKSHLARAFHRESARAAGPFVVLDCSQVTSEQTMAAELFGFAPQSGFANAPERGRAGAAELAHAGTLFIDEISAVPPALQQRLLGLVQTGSFCRLGTGERTSVDLQIVAATNEDPHALVQDGRFREDLLWRLAELVVELPPLDARAADIPELARAFLRAAHERFDRDDVQDLAPSALEALLRHPWSGVGNIRGLEHTILRSVLLAPAGTARLEAAHLQFQAPFARAARTRDFLRRPPPAAPPAEPAAPAPGAAVSADAPLLERKIHEHGGTVAAMASDAELCRAFGYQAVPMPASSLKLKIRRAGLAPLLERERRRGKERLGRAAPELTQILAALRQHRSGTQAARALGINRDVLVWRLQQAGLGIRQVLGSAPGTGQGAPG